MYSLFGFLHVSSFGFRDSLSQGRRKDIFRGGGGVSEANLRKVLIDILPLDFMYSSLTIYILYISNPFPLENQRLSRVCSEIKP